ncbi:MAG: S1 RNA-binding domain-containing protein [Campylobacteraceae bacterium]|nr:S1 RNA-binding domain-containing protein [Campylobacteraceae bacterium]MBT4707373.1 S1 RNA-binding domain-containing protein [Campylobacteraceae bacterium]MBT7273810.1 S1 RNA-binding domain-containing protein [Campylobacteraceae bacterium]
MTNLIQTLKSTLSLNEKYIQNIITLLEEGSTIAFIARYRKDMTGNASDETLLKFQELYEYSLKLLRRKEDIETILKEKDSLTSKIKELLNNAKTLVALDDIYEPFKGTKNTRADSATKNGLEGLANIISSMKYDIEDIKYKAKSFLSENIKTIDEAIAGAKDIIALRYSQEIRTKDALRKNLENYGVLSTKKTKTFEEDGLYKNLIIKDEKVKWLKSHRLLAIFRAVNEKQISLKIDVDELYLINGIKQYRIPSYAKSSQVFVFDAYCDGLKRLLLPSLKRELLSNLKQKASDDAINLFGKNLNELLISPPLVNQVILGLDPGYKTGCKLAVIDENGNYLASDVIYLLSKKQEEQSGQKVLSLIKKYKITAIAIGNGTASKESASFISELKDNNNLDINYAVVSEIGASVYSASKIAQEEYPKLDVTIRGAISIAQRLRDPMSALVKIDPKSLGVGQYQHDVNQKDLESKLNSTTFNLVNKVGVDLNSASSKLLSFVSGISVKMAANIIEYKNNIGGFKSKSQLLKVKGIGAKAYEQSVGFLRIKDGKSYLDNSGIHPESYKVAIYLKDNYDLDKVTNNDLKELSVKFDCGIESLKDILLELQKPGYDIREELEQISFCEDIKSIEQLKPDDIVSGVVRNITDFGAFIDIGLKNDALLHISEYSYKRINHLMDVLSVNQQFKKIRILSIDAGKNRVALSLKDI